MLFQFSSIEHFPCSAADNICLSATADPKSCFSKTSFWSNKSPPTRTVNFATHSHSAGLGAPSLDCLHVCRQPLHLGFSLCDALQISRLSCHAHSLQTHCPGPTPSSFAFFEGLSKPLLQTWPCPYLLPKLVCSKFGLGDCNREQQSSNSFTLRPNLDLSTLHLESFMTNSRYSGFSSFTKDIPELLEPSFKAAACFFELSTSSNAISFCIGDCQFISLSLFILISNLFSFLQSFLSWLCLIPIVILRAMGTLTGASPVVSFLVGLSCSILLLWQLDRNLR